MKQWFHNLKVSQKLMLISIFFVMPDSLMLYLFITGINANIEFARMEEKGNQYQRPLEELLELIPQHRLLAQRALAGDETAREQLAKKQNHIDGAFEGLEAVDRQIGGDLQFTDEGLAKRKREHYRVHTVRGEWQALKTQLAGLDATALAEQHQHLVADVRVMITHAGDLSNLILDPDLDSYYLMDATLLALPQTQERLRARAQRPPARVHLAGRAAKIGHLRDPAQGSRFRPHHRESANGAE
jgi:methyl-accepting chemotaxis protein